MAAAHVAGIVATYLEQYPYFTFAEVKERIKLFQL